LPPCPILVPRAFLLPELHACLLVFVLGTFILFFIRAFPLDPSKSSFGRVPTTCSSGSALCQFSRFEWYYRPFLVHGALISMACFFTPLFVSLLSCVSSSARPFFALAISRAAAAFSVQVAELTGTPPLARMTCSFPCVPSRSTTFPSDTPTCPLIINSRRLPWTPRPAPGKIGFTAALAVMLHCFALFFVIPNVFRPHLTDAPRM